MEQKQHNDCKIQVLMTVVDYGLSHTITELYQSLNFPINMLTHGHGAANSEIYEILGFGESKKIVIISVVTQSMVGDIWKIFQSEMNFNKPGTGISFTIPINSISSILSQLCISSNTQSPLESEELTMSHNDPHDLIITIINEGYFSQLMDVAKAAGAGGGTLLHARGIGNEDTDKFLGITLQPERDMVLILTPHEKKQKIMESITKEFGLGTDGKGICFSVPVNAALGLGTHLI